MAPEATKTREATAGQQSNGIGMAQPLLGQHSKDLQEIQDFNTIVQLPNGLSEDTCRSSIDALNQILADTMTLRDLYKKHHWQVSGPTFFELHRLFDKHFEQQSKLIDEIGERIQMLGGISVAMAHDVAEMTQIAQPPRGREEVPVQLSRLLEAHEIILKAAHKAAKQADEAGDDGTNDLLVSEVIRLNEKQVWFLAEHLVDTPLVQAE